MSEPEKELEPMAPSLLALVAVERRSPQAPIDGKARVRARLDATLLPGPGGGGGGGGESGGSSSSSPTNERDLGNTTITGGSATIAAAATTAGAQAPSMLARLTTTFVLGAVVGGALVYGLMPPKIVERRVEVAAADLQQSTPPVNVTTPRVERSAVAPEASSAASISTPSGSSASSPADSLVAERALLDPARTAIGRGDANSALDAVKKHEQRHPNGKLTEEREAIATQALVLAGRKEEARARGQRFLTRYPGSVLVPMVQAAIDEAAK